MGLRFRRSMTLIPGVRLNFNKNSIGISAGGPGGRVSINSNGRVTTSAGIPGSGLYLTESHNLKSQKSSAPDQHIDSSAPPSPHLFSSKSERAFNKFVLKIFNPPDDSPTTAQEVFDLGEGLIAQYPELKLPVHAIEAIFGVADQNLHERIYGLVEDLWNQRATFASHPITRKYLVGITPAISITKGISTPYPLNRNALGYLYSEVLQISERFEEALKVLDEVQPDQIAAIAIADLELSLKRYSDVLETTDEITNEDDATAMLLILRGIAFREQGYFEAARESFKFALAKKSRSEDLLLRALWERSATHEAEGKVTAAIKDLERIISGQSDYPGAREKIDELRT
jgi:tetratricopeptide (TPR) repeat protein